MALFSGHDTLICFSKVIYFLLPFFTRRRRERDLYYCRKAVVKKTSVPILIAFSTRSIQSNCLLSWALLSVIANPLPVVKGSVSFYYFLQAINLTDDHSPLENLWFVIAPTFGIGGLRIFASECWCGFFPCQQAHVMLYDCCTIIDWVFNLNTEKQF